MTPLELLKQGQPAILDADSSALLPHSNAAPLPDVAAAVEHALAHPYEFPPFQAAMVEGDRIVLAVESTLPSISFIIEGATRFLLAHDALLENIAVVLSPCSPETVQAIRNNLPAGLRERLAVYVHKPDDPAELGYLAASSEEALPIYVNRQVLDADVVLPITIFQSEFAIDYFGIAGIFPYFADTEVRKRCSTISNLGARSHQAKRCQAAEEAAWLLGVQCILKIVPAGNGQVLTVAAGTPSAVQTALQPLASAALDISLDQPAEIAIAEIDGENNEQTWSNVARALYTAKNAIKINGTIILMSQLNNSPSSSLRRLTGLEGSEKIEKQLSKEAADDTLTASLLMDYLPRARIFMKSALPQEAIEDLGVGFLTDEHEIEKLISNKRCVWIPAAQHRVIRPQ